MNLKNWFILLFNKPCTQEKRICSKCKQHIKARHKWHFVKGRPRHKDCKNPELKPEPIPFEMLPLFRQGE